MAGTSSPTENPVLHVVVIGFHHKKGCQVEYSYPPLIPGGEVDSHDVPREWKHLASLAVPDGAHNYVKDAIYFHLPAREGSSKTVYGVACYRQMDSKDLVNRTKDITRSTVQKSVCVLSYLPLYGLIQAKLELITYAYFKELDFSKVELLQETYKNLNLSLTESLLDGGSQVFLGMSPRDVVLQFKHKILLLFKLILLERRVLFTGTPVEKMSHSLLSVLSLFPGMIEHGLIESASIGLHRQISPTMKSAKLGEDTEEYLEIRYSGDSPGKDSNPDVELKLYANLGRSDSLEPESLTMERGDKADPHPLTSQSVGVDNSGMIESVEGKSQKKLKDSVNEKLKCDSLNYVENHFGNSSHSDSTTKVKGQRLELDVTVEPGSYDLSPDQQTTSPTDIRQVLLADSSMMMLGVTQLEAVQVGKSIPNNDSVINIEEYLLDKEGEFTGSVSERATLGSVPGDLSLSLDDSEEGLLKKTDSIEELDSPESISQIDREDCFSWEEDRLLLTIDHEEERKDTSTQKPASTKEETKDLASSFTDISLTERSESSVKSLSSNSSDKKIDDIPLDSEASLAESGKKPDQNAVSTGSASASPSMKAAAIKNRLTTAFSGLNIKQKLKSKNTKESSPPSVPAYEATVTVPVISQDNMGFPLAIFTKGSICHPYLSLQYFDLMSDVNVRSFVIGATNILFRQKRHLTDVVIEVNEGRIEIHDRELQKQLTLSTADLRFADILVKAVTDQTEGLYLDGTEWEGGDEWLRAQFRLYLESMLACTLTEDPRLMEDYGLMFINTWKTTHNYRVWSSSPHPGMTDVAAQHPCQGNLGMADIRVRLAHTMQSTERGKKLNAAVSQTGRYVVQTGKAVGGALTQAKSSLSSWFSNFTSDWKNQEKNSSPETSPAHSNKPQLAQVHTAGHRSSTSSDKDAQS